MRPTRQLRRGRVGIVCSATVLISVLFVPAAAMAQVRPTTSAFEGEFGPHCFATVVPDVTQTVGEVIGSREEGAMIYSQGDEVYLRAIGSPLQVGAQYLIYRIDGEIRHPRTGSRVGDAVNLIGTMEILDTRAERSMGLIHSNCIEVEAGDRLHPLLTQAVAEVPEMDPIDPARMVTVRAEDATVVHGHSESLRAERSSIGRRNMDSWQTYAAGDVITIDQGAAQGWQASQRAMLYREQPYIVRTGQPIDDEPVVVGQAVVFLAQENTAILVITDGDGTVRIGARARREE